MVSSLWCIVGAVDVMILDVPEVLDLIQGEEALRSVVSIFSSSRNRCHIPSTQRAPGET